MLLGIRVRFQSHHAMSFAAVDIKELSYKARILRYIEYAYNSYTLYLRSQRYTFNIMQAPYRSLPTLPPLANVTAASQIIA